jgi:hypothetical protein
MALSLIKKDGSEDGDSVADKVNSALEVLNTFTFSKVSDILDIPDSWTPICSVTSPNQPPGVFFVGTVVTGTFKTVQESAYVRVRVNGGAWFEYSKEGKDKTDSLSWSYAYPFSSTTTADVTVELEAKKEAGSNKDLDIDYADAWIRREN